MRRWTVVGLILIAGMTAGAQTATPEGGTSAVVEIAASDGLMLKGELFMPTESEDNLVPAVLLMHMNNSNRRAWEPIIPVLNEAGYAALAVDLRGFGETRGGRDFTLAQQDTLDWLTYLRSVTGIDPERVAVMGGSIGANLAIVGCAADEVCVTAVALSPGLAFLGVEPEPALVDGLRDRSALLVAAHSDAQSAIAVRQMVSNARGDVGMRMYTGGSHGTNLFAGPRGGSVMAMIVDWLDEQMGE